ncbi:MAG: peptide MFS transporter [Bacteroidota bacterium]
MLKGHPKGLLVAFFSNMGERFGFYTMMAILVLFLQAKYGLSSANAGSIYSWFYFSIYALALLGGILADSTKKYKLVILAGIIIMFAGYVIMALPGMTLAITVAGLFIIALGNGLFKGNLQAVVGQMYDDPKYSALRDKAFMIFYMGINVGAFFAPFAARSMKNWWLETNGYIPDDSLPSLCHQYMNGTMTDPSVIQQFHELADKASLSGPVADLSVFANQYIEVFSKGYNYAFGVAAVAMVISLLVYVFFNKKLPTVQKEKKAAPASGVSKAKVEFKPVPLIVAIVAMAVTAFGLHFIKQIGWDNGVAIGLFSAFIAWVVMSSKKEEKARITALVLVFVVAVFFWMSFHQNGLTLTLFARDYTVKQVGAFTNLFFTLPSMLAVIGAIAGIIILFYKNLKTGAKIIGAALFVISLWFIMFFTYGYDPTTILSKVINLEQFGPKNSISPEVFQSFNPLFIVALTFPVMAVFTWLNKKGLEPSTPKKIGIGLIIASLGFLVVLIGSIGTPSPASLQGAPVLDSDRVSPYWLVSSYLILTVAELFLSPMGLSFVSKVAPSRFQGLMQGGWLLATATGNKLLFVGTLLWDKISLSSLWLVFIVCLLLSATFIFSILKRLEKASAS